MGNHLVECSNRWRSKRGSFDTLNARLLFPSDNELGIPAPQHVPLDLVPTWLMPYRTRVRSQQEMTDSAVHFFLDDYRFETVWNRPRKALEALAPYETLLTPDFSLYRDWPLSSQIYNVYRSRWCGCFWQSEGFSVIPTISWSTAESYCFCFLCLPKRSVVAVGTVGVNLDHPLEYQLFVDGFREMVNWLQPSLILCYGPAPSACFDVAKMLVYPTQWQGIRAARRGEANGRECVVAVGKP